MGARAYLFKGFNYLKNKYSAQMLYSHWGADQIKGGEKFSEVWHTAEETNKPQIITYEDALKIIKEKDIFIELTAMQYINEFGVNLVSITTREFIKKLNEDKSLYVDITFKVYYTDIEDEGGLKEYFKELNYILKDLHGFFNTLSYLPLVRIGLTDMTENKIMELVKIYIKDNADRSSILPAIEVKPWIYDFNKKVV